MLLLPQIIIIMKMYLLKLVLKMLFFLVAFVLFLFVTVLMIQQENYEAAMLSMLLFTITAILFGHYKEKWIDIELAEDKELELAEE